MSDSQIHLDAAAVKVLAHPLRSRLLSALRRGGPTTATELADQLDTNTGATSYHLRKLASVGLVEDTGEGEGRRREWRAASRLHSWDPSDFAEDEDATTALNWLMRDYLTQFVARYQDWLNVEDTWPLEWRDATGHDDDMVVATPEQLHQMRTEIWEVVQRYRQAGSDDPAARAISVHYVAYPRDPRAEP
ncbi:ArsR/SmtB family transcription factor [Nocardioides sambongensis]|uniref:ArsR/SmtB family transcription factor n=1 Tax=Nocardioides sambongensis TaxID=2589074 RepID=UPI0011282708|nr:helix-turn-helix domain-containing protein [Nocardioides sambongensis]